jgi:hypothetical protein
MGFVVSADMEDNLAFMAIRQLRWTTGTYFVQGGIALFEIPKGAFRNVGDVGDFREGMSAALDQAQGSASSFGSPLESLHDVIDQLRKN